MSLWGLPEKETAEIKGFCESLAKEYQIRLRELGFDKNEKIACLKSSPFRGPRTYQIGDSVFSLAEDVAQLILIEKR